MVKMMRRLLVAAVLVAAWSVYVAPVSAEQTAGPFENIKTAPVPATWKYSNDGGKTFADKPFPGPPAGKDPRQAGIPQYPFAWKGTFEIADPAKVAGLWVRIAEEGDNPRASICNGDIWAASGGWWQDLGFCPTLLDAVVILNGKEVHIATGPILQFWVPLVGEIKKGMNSVELRGNVYTYWKSPPCKALDAKIIAAEPQPAEINNGPVVGDFGDDYFTVACRTQMPAEVTVIATATEPAVAGKGNRVTVVSAGKVWHRMKIDVPGGTRKVSYTVSAKVGPHETKSGPYTVTLPGKEYRFVAFGGAMQQPGSAEIWKLHSQLVLRAAKPDFVVNTGNLMEQESWSFQAEECYTAPGAELLARVPTLVTPCNRDFTGIFNELHYTPAADGYAHNWTKVIGPVRFIGIDGNTDWAAGGQNAKWLEGVLSAAKDKFVVVLSGYPAYTSGINSKRMFGGRQLSRDVIMPLLGKYNATVMLSSWDPDYERIEPTPDKGVTQIVTGCIAKGSWHKWDSRFGSHPFGPPGGNPRGTVGKVVAPDGREWVGYFGLRHFCVFEVKDDAMEMHVQAPGSPDTVIDKKTFRPRS